MSRKCAVVLAVVLIIGCSTYLLANEATASAPRAPDYWPTEGWRTSTPEEQGMDSEKLAEALDFIRDEGLNVHSLLVIRNGYVVIDAYFYPFQKGSTHDLASATKSFTSTLVGIAIDKGYIESVHTPVLELFPNRTVANVDVRKKAMTIEDVLMMSSGLECVNSPTEVTLEQMWQTRDWIQFTLDLPMRHEPGSEFCYLSNGSHLLSGIVHERTGMIAFDFAQKNLFGPLGISDVFWPTDPFGDNNTGWGNLHLVPHGMAKLGSLYLHDGVWDGKQILSREYVKAATSMKVSFKNGGGYGYQWWIYPERGTYAAEGKGHQEIIVVPEKNMVVVFTAAVRGPDGKKLEQIMPNFIAPAAVSDVPLPTNPKGVDLLTSKIKQAAKAPKIEPKPVPPLPETALKVSGKTYFMDPNPYGIRSLKATFEEGKNAALVKVDVIFFDFQGALELSVGLDDVSRFGRGRYGMPAASKGSWKTDNTFVFDFDEIGNINHFLMTVVFEGETIQFLLEESSLTPATITGRLQR
jgi:CubicO group peptidase (beta-lactamase class C family)